MSTGRQGFHSRRSSCISKGSALALAAAALTPSQKRSSRARSSGSSVAASRSAVRRMPSVSISRSIGRPSGPAISETRPRDDAAVEVHLPEPVLAVAEALGEPEVARRCRPRCAARPSGRGATRTGPSSPSSAIVPFCFGSGRRASQCQAAAVAAAASPVPAKPTVNPARIAPPARSSSQAYWLPSQAEPPFRCALCGLWPHKAHRKLDVGGEAAFGLELVEVGLHHHRRGVGAARPGRRPRPRRAGRRGSARRARGRRAGGARASRGARRTRPASPPGR